ncbi:tRNA glutamyl-Q(34) synthetase GluQRS [Neobittarella massiliensis]|uniref:Glutamyl-Q tRNA(Asp) synthetase n=1 Tax=Neobittarella massiliensis (ex Bilen et al. 2018) TaxID=2041842 RepID=A0A8J6IM91_9FIRM|nr:tRNA glutamyl-Q(34) synthetase GluQRS [Neobittarella massiliensis]MBC3516129.1 tRNA glutamyl-Q(34) synthetase GluQRS [Neobittarella massiliensis]
MSSTVVGRFAPTPSGRLHLGNLFCSLLAWLSAKSQNGRVLLRIEDLDTQRTSEHYTRQLQRDLHFLGLDWDEGGDLGGPNGPYWQSQRSSYYQQCLDTLSSMELTYPCFCSRAQLHAAQAPHLDDGQVLYPGTCRDLTPQQIARRTQQRPPAVRLQVPDRTISFTDGHYGKVHQHLPTQCGDFILRRSDGVFAYQLAVAADDGAMGVTEVVRGRDLLSSTPRQLWLLKLLGFPAPRYAHTPLLLAPDGRRLSKRDGDVSLSALQKKGYTAADIIGRLAWLAGLQPRPQPVLPAQLAKDFSWDKVPHEDILLPPDLF